LKTLYDPHMKKSALLMDTITDATDEARGHIVISGSHGGHYPAALASRAGIRAVIFNDAGIGLEEAGVAGVLSLADVGMAAAATDCQSCRIGSAQDAVDRGRISVVNAVAARLGVEPGMSVADALDRLADAPTPDNQLPPYAEARSSITLEGTNTEVWLLDSASLVKPEDAGKIVITASHGALIGGDPTRALKADARITVFNDAGIGIDEVGVTRLPALDQKSLACVTVDCMTARIGDAASALETGIISRVNETAKAMGAEPGMPLKDWL
jgi:hypothetical protein